MVYCSPGDTWGRSSETEATPHCTARWREGDPFACVVERSGERPGQRRARETHGDLK